MGGFIHVLLVIAIVVVLINVIQGRRALWRPWNASPRQGPGGKGGGMGAIEIGANARIAVNP
jgi:hypothetical protein